MPPRLLLILAVAVGLLALGLFVSSFAGTKKAEPAKGAPAVSHTLYDFEMKRIDGKPEKLSHYEGKTVLVVNTASKCGNTPQYAGLEKLYEKYKDRGFVILAFPANNFLGQEPGSDEQIAEFCSKNYGVTFPLYSKISVKGKDIAPLYTWLTTGSGFDGDIEWNFAKFLVGPDGKVVARFNAKVDPLSEDVTSKIEAALPAKKASS